MKRFLYIFLFLAFLLPFPTLSEPAKNVVINEIQITGGTGKTSDDFINLYNPTSSPFNLKGYRLVKRTAEGVKDTSIKSWTSDAFIPVNGFYLWANSNYNSIAITPDVRTSQTIADNNGVALRLGKENEGQIIDSVAWGSANNDFVETSVYPNNPGADQSIIRMGGDDSNNNAEDFVIFGQDNGNGNADVPESDGGDLDGVYINEVMPDPESPKSDITDEWIELYNDTEFRIDLSGAILRDSVGVVHEYTILDGTFIEPKSYIVFYSSATKITLNNTGDTVELLDKSRNIVDQTPDYEKSSAGQTFALFPDGWAWIKRSTPLSANIIEEDMADVKTVKASSTASKKKSPASKNSKSKSKPSSSVKGASTKKEGSDSPIDSDFAATENSGKPLSGKTLGMILLALSFIAGAAYIVNREKIYEIYQQKN